MEKLFELEQFGDPRRVRFASMKLRSHASLWWDKLWLNIECSGSAKIKTWDRMVSKMKHKFFACGLCFEFVEEVTEFEAVKYVNKRVHIGFLQDFYKV